MGPDGRLMKLDNLQTALRFVQLHLGGKPHPDYPGVYKETYRMEELVSTYKRSLRKKKMKKNEERLAQLSKTPLELSEISHIVDCQPMLDDLHDLVRVTEVTVSWIRSSLVAQRPYQLHCSFTKSRQCPAGSRL